MTSKSNKASSEVGSLVVVVLNGWINSLVLFDNTVEDFLILSRSETSWSFDNSFSWASKDLTWESLGSLSSV
jgi:hypothetical protein